MKTIADVKGRCRIDDDGCWIWAGAVGQRLPRIYGPIPGGKMATNCGRRAVWHMCNPGEHLPKQMQVFGKCGKTLCVNPACASVGPKKQQGALASRKGWLKGDIRRSAKSRTTGRSRTVLTPDLVAEIQSSPETGEALAARLGVSPQLVSKARRGGMLCFQPVGGLFSGLMQGAGT